MLRLLAQPIFVKAYFEANVATEAPDDATREAQLDCIEIAYEAWMDSRVTTASATKELGEEANRRLQGKIGRRKLTAKSIKAQPESQ